MPKVPSHQELFDQAKRELGVAGMAAAGGVVKTTVTKTWARVLRESGVLPRRVPKILADALRQKRSPKRIGNAELVLQSLVGDTPIAEWEAMMSDPNFQKVWRQVKDLYLKHKRDNSHQGWKQLGLYLDSASPDALSGPGPGGVTSSGTRSATRGRG